MLNAVEEMIRKLPPPALNRNPNVACAVGFLFGGIGLAIYLRTFVDFVLPVGIYLALYIITAGATDVAWIIGAIVAALYGYFRVQIANESKPESP